MFLHKKILRARLLHVPFDYIIRLVDYFVRASKVQLRLENTVGRFSMD